MKFKVGDSVIVTKQVHNGDEPMLGRVGKVGVVHFGRDYEYGVDFGPGFDGHSILGFINSPTGWNVMGENLSLTKPHLLKQYFK